MHGDLAQPGVDTQRVEHVVTRKTLCIFGVFKLTQTDRTRRVFTYKRLKQTTRTYQWQHRHNITHSHCNIIQNNKVTNYILDKSASMPHRQSTSLHRMHNGRIAASWWLSVWKKSAFNIAMTLTFHLEDLFSNSLSRDQYLWQVSLKSLH